MRSPCTVIDLFVTRPLGANQLVHGAGWLLATGLADNTRWNAGYCLVAGDRVQHHRARSNLGARPNFDISEDFRTGADQDAAAYFRVTITARLARASQCYTVQYGHIVVHYRCFAYHETCGVVDKNTLPHTGSRMDICLENR